MIIFKSIYTAFFFVVLSFLLFTPISLVFGEEEEFMGVVNMEPAIYPIPPGNYNATGCDGSYFMYNETECIVALDGSIIPKTENTIDLGLIISIIIIATLTFIVIWKLKRKITNKHW